MTQYRKKPVVVEAFQMTKERRSDNSEWPNWLHDAWQMSASAIPVTGSVWFGVNDEGHLLLKTLSGVVEVSYGDWIIQGVQGELYPCKPDIFEATYELVQSEHAVPQMEHLCKVDGDSDVNTESRPRND